MTNRSDQHKREGPSVTDGSIPSAGWRAVYTSLGVGTEFKYETESSQSPTNRLAERLWKNQRTDKMEGSDER